MKDELVLENIELVYFVLKKMNLYHKKDQYYDAGIEGLVRAAKNFNPDKGRTFSTLAVTCIRNQILMQIRAENKCVNTVSLDDTIPGDDNEKLTLMSMLSSNFDMEDHVVKKEEIKALYDAISKLEPDEQELIKRYYNANKITQCELAKQLNISQAHISRKIHTIIKKLQRYLNKQEVT